MIEYRSCAIRTRTYAGKPMMLEGGQSDIANSLTSVAKDSLVIEMPKVVGGIGEKKSNSGTQYYQQDRVYQGNIAMAHPANIPGGSYKYMMLEGKKIRIRKLTPKECWRLMDFEDDQFERAEQVNSNTQLYKQAGNSIVVNCLVAILGQMFEGKEDLYKQRQEKWSDEDE